MDVAELGLGRKGIFFEPLEQREVVALRVKVGCGASGADDASGHGGGLVERPQGDLWRGSGTGTRAEVRTPVPVNTYLVKAGAPAPRSGRKRGQTW